MKIKRIYLAMATMATALCAASCSIDYKDVDSGVVKKTGTEAVMNLDVRTSGDAVSTYDLFVFNSTPTGNFLEYYSQNLPASSAEAISGSSDVKVGSQSVKLLSGGLKYVVAVGNPSSGVSYPALKAITENSDNSTSGVTTYDQFKQGLKVSVSGAPSAPFALMGKTTVADAAGTQAFVKLSIPFTKVAFTCPDNMTVSSVQLCNVPASGWPLINDFTVKTPEMIDYKAASPESGLYVLYTPGTKEQAADYRVKALISGTLDGQPYSTEYYVPNPMYSDYEYRVALAKDLSASISPNFAGDEFYVEGVRLAGSTLTYPFMAEKNYGYQLKVVTNIAGDVTGSTSANWCDVKVVGTTVSVRCIEDNLTGAERKATATLKLGSKALELAVIQQAQPTTDVEFCGMKWLDRNLGAIQPDDEEHINSQDAYGYYYQWGRNVPFPTFGDVVTTAADATVTAADANQMSQYILGDSEVNYDWWMNGAQVNDRTSTWKMRTGGTDPCPAGYHVPTYREFQNILPYTNGSGIGRLYADVRSATKEGEILDADGTSYSGLYVCSKQADGTIWAIKKYKTAGAYLIRWQRITTTSGTYLKITRAAADATTDFTGDTPDAKMASAISSFAAAEANGTGIQTFFVPSAGRRDRITGEPTAQGTTIYMWSASCWDANSSSPYVDPATSSTQRIYNMANNRAHGLPVRCVRD